MSVPEMGGSVWKWVAALLATAMLAGLPGYIGLYLNSPTREEVSFIRDRQDIVLQRLSAIDIRLANGESTDQELRDLINELRAIVLDLRADGGPASSSE